MNISFKGIGQWSATFALRNSEEGDVVKVNSSGMVCACNSGDAFCGVVLATEKDGRFGTVQMGGMAQVAYSDEAPGVGYVKLSADGNGGVRVNENGREYLIVEKNEAEKMLTIVL